MAHAQTSTRAAHYSSKVSKETYKNVKRDQHKGGSGLVSAVSHYVPVTAELLTLQSHWDHRSSPEVQATSRQGVLQV